MIPKLGLILGHKQTRLSFLFCNFLYVCVACEKPVTKIAERTASRKAPGTIKIETPGVFCLARAVENTLLNLSLVFVHCHGTRFGIAKHKICMRREQIR